MDDFANSYPKNSRPRVGALLRARRKERGLTLDQLASQVGLSRGFLSQVENDKASPSLASLVQISQALGADARDFLFVPPATSIASYAAHRVQYAVPESDVIYERTTGSFDGRTLNGLIITIPPGYSCEPQRHDGEEMYLVLDGTIFCEVDGKRFDLNIGDTVHFNSRELHLYGNPTTKNAKVMWVGTLQLFGEDQDKGDG
ncbi:XRE family transcriptional regulator [Roseovarius sp. Pro17]|uniref:helix-turn-helix domain-containing protein n=1 Tax=Roseovarius sp. Pro17 TaxID=3108175 RepID=UPI002D7874D3|nr:XRE family transcriptional regulator [Roseovarius sp. Pro17]